MGHELVVGVVGDSDFGHFGFVGGCTDDLCLLNNGVDVSRQFFGVFVGLPINLPKGLLFGFCVPSGFLLRFSEEVDGCRLRLGVLSLRSGLSHDLAPSKSVTITEALYQEGERT